MTNVDDTLLNTTHYVNMLQKYIITHIHVSAQNVLKNSGATQLSLDINKHNILDMCSPRKSGRP